MRSFYVCRTASPKLGKLSTMHVTVIADFIKVYNRRILRGVAAFARIHGWTLQAQQVQNRQDVAHALKTAEAILMGTHDYESEPSLEDLHVPAVSWSATRELVPWPRVISDDCAVGRMAARGVEAKIGERRNPRCPGAPGRRRAATPPPAGRAPRAGSGIAGPLPSSPCRALVPAAPAPPESFSKIALASP